MANILITGASSGIGRALALAYAAPGVTLILWGRDGERLQEAAEACRARGARAETTQIDLLEVGGLDAQLAALDERLPLDLAIFNAGLGGTTPYRHRSEDPGRAHNMALVNFASPIIGAATVGERMAARRRGQVVLVGSIAGTVPLPMSPAYSGAKAGLDVFADALGLRLEASGVGVTIVLPGFIDTPMSRAVPGPQPLRISAERAAEIIRRRVARRARRITVPRAYAVVPLLRRLLPSFVGRTILRFVDRQHRSQTESSRNNVIP